jgi:hypothetical protein
MKALTIASLLVIALLAGHSSAHAQGRDSLANGTIIGAAVGAGLGLAFTHAVRDSDLTAGQYARDAAIFGALGAGIGAGIDALLNRGTTVTPRRILIVPGLRRHRAGIGVVYRW